MSDKSDRDNRSNQLNPNNGSFHSSRMDGCQPEGDDEVCGPPSDWSYVPTEPSRSPRPPTVGDVVDEIFSLVKLAAQWQRVMQGDDRAVPRPAIARTERDGGGNMRGIFPEREFEQARHNARSFIKRNCDQQIVEYMRLSGFDISPDFDLVSRK